MIEEEIGPIVLLTIKVSGTATLLNVIVGVPPGLWLAFRDFRDKRLLSRLLNFGPGLLPGAVGLVVSPCPGLNGPLYQQGLLYTPAGMTSAKSG